ncbi:hypothetical protein PL8927_830233 [Planktothrix serta PCC 8927]|uniref:Uncharacterized protein n=1 Tax=Planktothrix serta PCC 8927 TaxID=671068 RepID=A0A7Z9C3A4_9CYAN|nr:hypothetical protein [Planktothrix serta]VXD24962.1 hypothetical protein PL8927_830233 [Planktothrix serta PCC 8927]
MDILIESTKSFEEDIAKLDERDRVAVIEKINHYASLYLQSIPGFVSSIKKAEQSNDWVSEEEFMRALDALED